MKVKTGRDNAMGWKDKMHEFGGGDLAFLSEDGEVIRFMIVGEPILLEGKFKGRPSEKIGCPIMTPDGFQLFIAGKRLARKIAKYEDMLISTAFMAIRHGGQNDISATYELKVYDDKEFTKELLGKIKGHNFDVEIKEAVAAAKEVMNQ